MLVEIVFILLIVMNLVIYHKLFKVYYFNLGFGLIREIIGAGMVACLEIWLFFTIVPVIFTGVLSILSSLLGIIVFVALIVGAIIGIKQFISSLKSLKGRSEEKDSVVDVMEKQVKPSEADKEKHAEESDTQVKFTSHENVEDLIESRITKNIETGMDSISNTITDEKAQAVSALAEVLNSVAVEKKEEMFCTYCGEKIKRTSKFCKFCGNKITYLS